MTGRSLPVCAVLLAGGRGARFWPRSRMRTPKQLLSIAGGPRVRRGTAERSVPPCVRREGLRSPSIGGEAIERETRFVSGGPPRCLWKIFVECGNVFLACLDISRQFEALPSRHARGAP